MRALIIDGAVRARVAEVLDHAKTHHYHPNEDDTVPGDDDHFVAQLDTFRVVFSFTHLNGRVFRHLSISVPNGMLPHPIAAFMIAGLFGFTGWDESMGLEKPESWHVVAIMEPPVANLAQEIAVQ